jgi:hypothetical protein
MEPVNRGTIVDSNEFVGAIGAWFELDTLIIVYLRTVSDGLALTVEVGET